MRKCKGINCKAENGIGHSAECLTEYEESLNCGKKKNTVNLIAARAKYSKDCFDFVINKDGSILITYQGNFEHANFDIKTSSDDREWIYVYLCENKGFKFTFHKNQSEWEVVNGDGEEIVTDADYKKALEYAILVFDPENSSIVERKP